MCCLDDVEKTFFYYPFSGELCRIVFSNIKTNTDLVHMEGQELNGTFTTESFRLAIYLE